MLGEFIESDRVARLAYAAGREEADWLGLGHGTFAQDYNHRPFLVQHRLQEHPLFQRESLFDLCRRHPRPAVVLRAGNIPAHEDFGRSFVAYGQGMQLDDALEHFEERGAYIVINNPERDPIYRAPIEALLGEVAHATAQIDPGINWYSTYVFISSRDAVTPYHMDREMNFLFHVHGAKEVKLWDPADSEVMTAEQKDELLAYASELRPPYTPSIEAKARVFELRPGLGVHHPFIAPHIVRTGSDFSISFALTYRTRRTDAWTRAHRMNHELRKYGWQPQPVGESSSLDRNKAALALLAQRSLAAARSVRGMFSA